MFSFAIRLVFVLAVAMAIPLSAQITGSVEGVVVDSSSGAVAQANTTLKNLETGAERKAPANGEGAFTYSLLQIGNYELRVEASGFRTAISAVEVKAGETATVRLTMAVGVVTETITVTDAVSLLDAGNAQLQTSLTGRSIQEIPVARNPNAFATTAPGTAPVSANNPFLGSGSFNVNGMRGRGNNIVVDGITSTDVSSTGVGSGNLNPLNFATIKEVKVITNNFSAEYGRNMGSQVLYLTKSGGNALHGEAYEYFRNDVLNARSFFDTSGKADIVRRNEYGFEVGGPFRIPGYDGHDKTFWHTDWAQLKRRGASTPRIALVPTPAMIAQVTDPTSRALIEQYKLPSSPTGSIRTQAGETDDLTLFSFRGDQNIGSHDILWARYARAVDTVGSASLTFINTNLPGFGANAGGPSQQASLGETHLVGPRAVNEFRFGFAKAVADFPLNTPYPLGPRIEFASGEVDRFGLWESLPQGREQRTYQFTDNFSLLFGSHALKFGGEWLYTQADSVLDGVVRGLFTFANWTDFAAGRPQAYQQRFGTSAREYRVNNFFTFFQDDWKVSRNLTLNLGLRMEWAGGPFEKNGTSSNLDFENKTAYGAAGTGPFGLFGIGNPSFRGNTNWAPRLGFAWSPLGTKTVIRGGFGIAYDFIFLNPITNQRALPPFIVRGDLTGQASFAGDNTMARLVAGTSTFQSQTKALSGTLSSTTLNFGAVSPAIDQNLKNPQALQWNFGLQRDMLGLVFKAAYVGTKGNYLQRSHDINLIANRVAPATSLADETARLAQFQAAFAGLSGNTTRRSNRIDGRYNNISFLDNSANSIYHAFQFEALRRMGSATLNANYTWGKSIDNGSDALGVLINDSPSQQNPLDNRNNRAASQFDLRHRLVITYTWAVPWMKSSSNPFLKHALGGWNLAGITSFRTGFPVTLDAGTRRGLSPIPVIGGGAQVRPNASGPVTVDWRPTGSAGSPLGLNSDPIQRISAYGASLGLSQPLLGNFGTLGRNTLRLNGERNFDCNIYKNFTLRENAYFQIRAELYNAFNNTSFQEVNRNLSNTAFGQYTVVGQDARVIQLGARFAF